MQFWRPVCIRPARAMPLRKVFRMMVKSQGAQVRAGLKTFDIGDRLHQRLLDQIVGFLVIPGQGPR